MRKIIVTGFIKTSAPLHIAAPGSVRFNPETGEKAYGDIGVPLTGIQTIGVPGVIEHRDSDGVVTTRPGMIQIPVIPGNNWSGRLRRTIADVFLEALQAAGQKVTINTYSAIKTGAATGSPDGQPISYDEYQRATNHPFLGLLGGGPRLIKRKAQVHNAIALCKESKDLLDRNRIPYGEIYGGWDQTLALHMTDLPGYRLSSIWSFRRTDELRDLVNIVTAEKSIADFQKAFNARQGAIIEEFKNGKGDKAKTSVFTFQALEFVTPGVSFPFVAVMDNPTDAQAGLWFSGFERFCQNETIGGWSRNGFGNFTFEDGRIAVVEDGEVLSEQYSPSAINLDDEGSYRMRAATAWNEAAETVNAEEMEYLMRLPAEKASKEKKEKTK